MDSKFAHTHDLPLTSVPPIQLRLFDGTSNAIITQSFQFLVTFYSSESMTVNMFVTLLDSSCSVVLGYNWLTCYNPSIDWVLGSIKFHLHMLESPTLSLTSSAKKVQLPSQNPVPPRIALIGAAAFALASKQPSVQSFRIHLSDPLFSTRSASISDEAPDLSNVPEEYHKFADVFSKAKADTLAPHHPYDLKINLEEVASPPINPMYSLSQSKLTTLWEFINEHLQIGFIHPTNSPHRAPVLSSFGRRMDLSNSVNFRGLNKISKKDQYPLLFISDLLTSAGKAHIYTALDLHHAYHLVSIVEGDEWKTAFCTCYRSFEWMVMPFGLTNTLSTFQRFMNDIFSDLLDITVTVYLDNILIYSDDPSKHKEHVHKVLYRLRKHGLYCCPDKCKFSVDSIKYLGFILLKQFLKMDSAKIQTIVNWPEPRKVKDI